MFGYLRGSPSDRTYRQIYAWCCSSGRVVNGYRSLPLVSYEAVFAAALAIDAGLAPGPDNNAVTCCKTRKRHSAFSRDCNLENQTLASFYSVFAMLLCEIKLRDDVRDDQSIGATIGTWIFRNRFQKAHDWLTQIDSDFEQSLGRFLDEHQQLENGANTPKLEAYVQPTGNAFAYVFGLLPIALFQSTPPENQTTKLKLIELFQSVGRLIGESLIAFDCAVDFPRDRRRGHFNPLANRESCIQALEFAERKLIECGWRIAEQLPELTNMAGQDGSRENSATAVTTRILQHRAHTVRTRRQTMRDSTGATARVPRRNKFPSRQWGWLTPRRLQRGDCDCLCEGCCEAMASGVDCCNAGCFSCDACCHGGCDSSDTKRKPKNGISGDPRDNTATQSNARALGTRKQNQNRHGCKRLASLWNSQVQRRSCR